MSTDDQKQSGRIRRSTLERFNDEMSVLDHPIEQDIDPEFYEAEPPSRRPRIVATLIAALVFGGGGFLFLSQHMGGAAASSEVAIVPVASMPAPVVRSPMPVPPAEPAAVEATPAETAPADSEAEVDAVPSDMPSVATAIAPSAWTKIGRAGSSSTRAKHARPTTKISRRR